MDQYAENKLKYPNAKFSYIGHSNGTYLLAKALEQYPACKFHNVLLAGSVVNGSYNWNKIKAEGRISKIYNIAATSDWVVGIFPNALGTIGYRELGAGGYWGFKDLRQSEQEVLTIPGGHGAGIMEERWKDIAEFIVDDSYYPKFQKDEKKRRIAFWPILAVLLFIGIVCLIVYGAYSILHGVEDGAIRMLALIAYVFVLWKILTKF
jgi:pimeloyl-ACP methyl ester carboxylesterase